MTLPEVMTDSRTNSKRVFKLRLRKDPFGRRSFSRCITYVPVGSVSSDRTSCGESEFAKARLTDGGKLAKAFPVFKRLQSFASECNSSIAVLVRSFRISSLVGGLGGLCSPPKMPEAILIVTGYKGKRHGYLYLFG